MIEGEKVILYDAFGHKEFDAAEVEAALAAGRYRREAPVQLTTYRMVGDVPVPDGQATYWPDTRQKLIDEIIVQSRPEPSDKDADSQTTVCRYPGDRAIYDPRIPRI